MKNLCSDGQLFSLVCWVNSVILYQSIKFCKLFATKIMKLVTRQCFIYEDYLPGALSTLSTGLNVHCLVIICKLCWLQCVCTLQGYMWCCVSCCLGFEVISNGTTVQRHTESIKMHVDFWNLCYIKMLPVNADWEEVSCGRPVPRTQDQWGGRWSWLCSRLPDLYSVQTAQCTTHCSPVVSDKYHHSVVSVLLLCCRCQLNKMTPKLNQTCLVNVKERVSYLCLGKVYRWMDLNVMIT